MSDGEGKKVTLWDGIVEYYEPVLSARTEAVRGAIDAGLLKFEPHKDVLLTILRDAHNDSPKSECFDESRTWSHLTNLAGTYHWEARVKQETMPSGDRAKRLLILATALEKAHRLIDRAMEDDVGDDLFSAWQKETDEPPVSVVRNDDSSLSLVQNAEEKFRKQVAGLAALDVAAHNAADKVRLERVGGGRPRGTSALPQGYILTLADFYRKSTAAEPAIGDGQFARFVRAFLDAVGQKRITERHLIEMIEDAFVQGRKNPPAPLPSSNQGE
jgi:hypothetical protein